MQTDGGLPVRKTSPDALPVTTAPPRRPGVLRELRAWPTVLLVAFCLLVGYPVTVALTPAQDVVALGQHLSVGARTPTPTFAGPAQLVQIGNTELDMPRLRIHGPLRPRLTMGPVQRNAAAAQVFDPLTSAQAQAQAIDNVSRGFLRWYLWGGLGLLVFAIAAAAGAGCLRMLAVLRARSRAGEDAGPHAVAEIWHHLSGAIARMTAIAVAASALAWVAAGGLAYTDTVRGLQKVEFAHRPGRVVVGVAGAGRSGGHRVRRRGRRRLAGGPGRRTAAVEPVARGRGVRTQLRLPGRRGRRPARGTGPQPRLPERDDRGGPARAAGTQRAAVAAAGGVLKQVQGLQFVAVAIGPNDLGWSDLVTYCYAVENCADNLSQGEFDYRLSAFDRDYGTLLAELAALPGQPQVVVVTSYDALPATIDPACPDLRGPAARRGPHHGRG